LYQRSLFSAALISWRRAANWAIVNGETETGVTTMFIEPTLDTGPILLQRKTEIGETKRRRVDATARGDRRGASR
jgi:methionyl-tRNA formyltransferase